MGTGPTVAKDVEADGLPYLLYVGNVKPNKNLSLLLHAFDKVMRSDPYRLYSPDGYAGLGPTMKQ